MRMPPSFVLMVATLAAAPAARAADHGLSLALRAGYGIPLGSLSEGTDFNKVLEGAVPMWIDAGYRFNNSIFAGAFFQYGFASVADDWKTVAAAAAGAAGGTASDFGGSDVRLGIQGIYSFIPDAAFAPWVGIGFGYEWASTSFKLAIGGATADATIGFHGFEGMIQIGGDYRVSPMLSVGPFVAFTLAQFSGSTVDASAAGQSFSQSIDIPNKGWHEWLQLGLKGTFNL